MSEPYEILSVGDPREWSSGTHGGRFLAYPLRLQGVDEEVEWSRKADSKPPRVGDTIWADLQGGPHGMKAKVDWDAMKANGPGSGGGGGFAPRASSRREYKPEHEFDPAKTARITRSHAQKVAVDLVVATPGFGQADDDRKREVLTQWTDFFETDVEEAAAQKTAQRAGGTLDGGGQPPVPAQTQEPAEESIPF